MSACQILDTAGKACPGEHLGKFSDCLTEALYQLSLDGSDPQAGDTDFEGHLTLMFLSNDEVVRLEPGWDDRMIAVPLGTYLLSVASSGFVTYALFDSLAEAEQVFDVADTRHAAWERGCDPDNLGAHEDCEGFEQCLAPDWVNA